MPSVFCPFATRTKLNFAKYEIVDIKHNFLFLNAVHFKAHSKYVITH